MMSLCRAFPSELALTSGGDPRGERVTVAETSCKVTHRVQIAIKDVFEVMITDTVFQYVVMSLRFVTDVTWW